MPVTPIRIRLSWLTLACAVIFAAWISLHRLEQRKLFVVHLPFARQPLDVEIQDAATTARRWIRPALVFLTIASMAVISTASVGPWDAVLRLRRRLGELFRARRVLCSLFSVACVADFLSTLWYFHEYGLHDELHPGIKLVTYAWGPSVGCLAAKSIQAALVLLVCVLFPRFARVVLIAVTLAYVGAAIWNLGAF